MNFKASVRQLTPLQSGAGCAVGTHCMYKQREAVNTTLPIGVRQIETMRTMLTQSVLLC